MGCGAGRPYTANEVDKYVTKCQLRLPSAELIDGGVIKLTSTDGFFNSSALLDATWLQGKLTNSEYRQAIEHINQRTAQCIIGTSNNLPIDQIPKTQSGKLAVQELNAKYADRVHFVYQDDSVNTSQSSILISFK